MSNVKKILFWSVLGVVTLFALVIFFIRPVSRSTSQDNSFTAETGLGGAVAPSSFSLNRGDNTVSKQASPEMAYDASVQGNLATNQTTDRLIIKTGTLSMVVKDVREAVSAIAQYATKNAGFVVMSSVDKRELALYGQITIRIPAEVFDVGVSEVKQMGEVKSEIVNGQDVTEEYTDLGAQLNNLKATETQFLAIMQKAVKIEDILAVQRELTIVRGQIEGIQGRMKYLKENAQMSTLTVQLSTDPSVLPVQDDQNVWKPWAEVKDAVRSLIGVGQGLVNVIIWIAVYIPVWVLIFVVVWTVKHYYRKNKRENILKN
jgi:hypothetical protein